MTKKIIYILNGCNLDKLGQRETHIYGSLSLGQIEGLCRELCKKNRVDLIFFQTNAEAELIEKIHEALEKAYAIVINAAAFTHSSIAIRDALIMFDKKIVEVHLSNIFKRETFRHHSYIADVAHAVICGCGAKGYLMAIDYLTEKNNN